MKKYLMKSAAAIVIGLAASACSHDLGFDSSAERASIDNAQETLGFYIPENQDWVMSSMVSANLPITGTEGETYTVKVYSNDPLVDNIGYILAQKEVKSGENFVSDFRAPSYMTSCVIGITNSIGKTTYETASLVNGQLTSFSATRATRANSGKNYPATHEYEDANGNVIAGANMNHNEWADPDKEFGGWLVPPALTEAQKALVASYFQTVKDLKYKDPELRHFFVQQVYKGGNTKVNNTTEGIIAADGSAYTSDNMNLLTVGQYNSHINDFNAGSCSVSNVLDNGQHVGGTSHEDQITLMVNVDDTSCFGYHETGSSTHHNDKAALVSWETISKWAGIYGTPDDILNDGWNRSFLGFDLAIKEGDQCFMQDDNGQIIYANYSQLPEGCTWWDNNDQVSYIVAWDGEKVVKVGIEYAWDNRVFFDDYKYLAKTNGTKAGWLTTNENFYVAGMSKTIPSSSQNSLSDESVILKEFTIDGIKYQALINLPAIKGLLDEGYLPVNDKTLTEWVKPGVSDGYFSDWIVTLTDAEHKIIEEKQIWSYAFEDSNRKSDYDMNDVVVKVQESMDGTKLNFKLVAAGCEYSNEVYFNGTVITWNNGSTEVHDALGVAKGVLTNTKARTGVDGKTPATASITKPAGFDPQLADIKIKPSSGDVATQADGGDGFVHIAETGKQPTGIIIPWDWSWPTERTSIVNAYNKPGHSFAGWASDNDNLRRVQEADWFKYPTGSVTE